MMHVLLCYCAGMEEGKQIQLGGRPTYFCCFLKFFYFSFIWIFFGFCFCFSLSDSSAFFSSLIYAPMVKPTQQSCTHNFSTRTSVEGFRSRNCPCGRTGIEPDPRSINRWSHLCLARRSQKEEEWGRWANARLLACAKIFQSHYSALFFLLTAHFLFLRLRLENN